MTEELSTAMALTEVSVFEDVISTVGLLFRVSSAFEGAVVGQLNGRDELDLSQVIRDFKSTF